MTKNQRKRLGVSDRQLTLLRRIRQQEIDASGRGVSIDAILDGSTGRQVWITLQSLVRRELVRLDHENRVRTTARAREMNQSWRLTATATGAHHG